MKTLKQFFVLIVIALVAFAVIGCKDEPDPTPQPQPVAQSKTITGIGDTGAASITVNYTALPGTTPSYMPILEKVVRNVFKNAGMSGNFTINVIAGGNDSFALAGPGTLSAGETWISGATEMEMGQSMNKVAGVWIAQ